MEASALPTSHGFAMSPRILRLAGDDRLVGLIRAGNEVAFEVVYDRYHRQLLSFCRHMLGRATEAEDAVQQTFISAYADLKRSDRPIALRAWLFTIARNRCLSILRARRETASLDDVEPETAGLASEVQRREDLRAMLGDIAGLPEDQRAALVLAELGDLDHGEIAQIVGCPKEKVKALVFQARSSLSLNRQARDTSCAEIREQLATLRGGALRRSALRRHLRGCAGCREFRDEVRRQRAAMAVLLPVVPAAGLKKAVLAGSGITTGGTAAGGGAAAGGLGAAVAKLTSLKVIGAVAAVAAGAAGTAAVVENAAAPVTSSHTHRAGHAAGHGAPVAAAAGAAATADSSGGASRASAAGTAHSHRALAHRNALAHGRGLKRGLLGTQPGHNRTSTFSHGQGHGTGTARRRQGSSGTAGSHSHGGNGGSQAPLHRSASFLHPSHSQSNATPGPTTPPPAGARSNSPKS